MSVYTDHSNNGRSRLSVRSQRHLAMRLIFSALLLLAVAATSMFVSHAPTAHAQGYGDPHSCAALGQGTTIVDINGNTVSDAFTGETLPDKAEFTWPGGSVNGASYVDDCNQGDTPNCFQDNNGNWHCPWDGSGEPFQCEELIQRYGYIRWGYDPLAWGDGAAATWATHPDPTNLVQVGDGTGVAPQPGDILVWQIDGNDPSGHIAIIQAVDTINHTLTTMEQNFYFNFYTAWRTFSYNATTDAVDLTHYTVDTNNGIQTYQVPSNQQEPLYGWLHNKLSDNLTTTDKWVGQVSNGELETFQVDNTGHISYSYQEGKGSANWSGWSQLSNTSGETFLGTPAVATNSDGRLFVFARGTSGKIWLATETTSGDPGHWNNWSNFTNPSGDSMVSNPAVAAGPNGQLYLFVIDNTGVVRLQNQTSPNGSWLTGYTQFTNPSGRTMVGDPAVAAGPNGLLYLFVRDNTGQIRLQNQTLPNDTWLTGYSQFTNPSGHTMVGDPVVAPDNNGELFLFVRDDSGVIREQNQTLPNNTWLTGYSQFTNPGSATMTGDPAAVRCADGRLYLFVRDNSGVVHIQNQTKAGGGWLTGYSQFSNPSGVLMVSDPAAGVDSTGIVQLFALGSDGTTTQMYRAYQITAGGSWHVLYSIGGSF